MKILVIGYGNELRTDDGLGPQIASAIEQEQLPGVRVITAHQLTPELAEPMSAADAVVFIDAAAYGSLPHLAIGQPDLVQVCAREGDGQAAQFRAHSSSPEWLVRLVLQLFGKCPSAWSLTIPVSDFRFGNSLSAAGQAAVPAAVELFKQFWRTISAVPNGRA